MANLSTTLKLPDGSASITVEARSGTQAVSHILGNPVNGTEPGAVAITINTPGSFVLDGDENLAFLRALIDTLTVAHRIAHTRDTARDLPTHWEKERAQADSDMVDPIALIADAQIEARDTIGVQQ